MNIMSIILKNKKTDERDLSIYVLTQTNEFRWIRIPGILKSKKRNTYLYVAGTIWEFSITNTQSPTWFSKEDICVIQPFGDKIEYQDLVFIQKLLDPLLIVNQEQNIDLYSTFFYVLASWSKWTENRKYYLLGRVYLKILKEIGLLDLSKICQLCDSVLNKNIDIHILGIGNTCMRCYQDQYCSSNYRMILISTILLFLQNFCEDVMYESEFETCTPIKEYLRKR